MAYYPADQLSIEGQAKHFERPTDEGNRFVNSFCPQCGSTVYARSGKHPSMIGIAVGAIADPNFEPPVRSVWEQSMHGWVAMPDDVQHFSQGRGSVR